MVRQGLIGLCLLGRGGVRPGLVRQGLVRYGFFVNFFWLAEVEYGVSWFLHGSVLLGPVS